MERLSVEGVKRIELALVFALMAGLGGAVLLACASLYVMTLSANEAWLLFSVEGLVVRGAYGPDGLATPFTTGGLFVAAETFLYWLAGNSLPVLRLFPLICLLVLLQQVYAWSRRCGAPVVGGLLACSAVIAVPGTLTLGSSAYGCVPAMLCLLVGLRVWGDSPAVSWGRIAMAAVLFGLACATRPNFLVVIPALMVAALPGTARTMLTRLRGAALCASLASVVSIACFVALVSLSKVGLADALLITKSGPLRDARLLPGIGPQNWVIAEGFMPFPLLVAATLTGVWLARDRVASFRQLTCLISFAWLLWIAWIWRAPNPALRYLWPALAAFAVVLGLGLAQLYTRGCERGHWRPRMVALSLGLACLASGGASTVRSLAVGDSNLVHLAWMESTAMWPYRLLHGWRDQRDMARYLRALPEDEVVESLGLSIELEFLTGRRFPPLLSSADLDHRPRRLLTTPAIGFRYQMDPRGLVWISQNCEAEVKYGHHVLYQVVGDDPPSSEIFKTHRILPMPPFRHVGPTRHGPSQDP